MMARPVGSFCSLLLLWLCAIGSGPASPAVARPAVARGAAELALRDMADAPLIAPRTVAARIAATRLPDRHDAPGLLAALEGRDSTAVCAVARNANVLLALQGAAYAGRPRWRAYDAAAPPRSPA